jgi:hypothetical protein
MSTTSRTIYSDIASGVRLPVNKTAVNVTSDAQRTGVHYEVDPARLPTIRTSTPPLTVPWPRTSKPEDNLTGQTFGRLRVIGLLAPDGSSRDYGRWATQCVCGWYEVRRAKSLKRPRTTEDFEHMCGVCSITEKRRKGFYGGSIK